MENFISSNIQYLLNNKKVTQDNFGGLFGLGKGVINQYLLKKSTPKIETIQRICKHYEILIDDFVNKDLSKEQFTYSFHIDSIGNSNRKTYGIRKGKLLYANEPEDENEFISPRYVESLEKTIQDKEKIIEMLEEKLNIDKKSRTA